MATGLKRAISLASCELGHSALRSTSEGQYVQSGGNGRQEVFDEHIGAAGRVDDSVVGVPETGQWKSLLQRNGSGNHVFHNKNLPLNQLDRPVTLLKSALFNCELNTGLEADLRRSGK